MSGLSKTQVRKAGKVLRRLAVGELVDLAEAERAFEVLMRYRREHAEALTKATMGLRSRVRTAGYPAVVVSGSRSAPRSCTSWCGTRRCS